MWPDKLVQALITAHHPIAPTPCLAVDSMDATLAPAGDCCVVLRRLGPQVFGSSGEGGRNGIRRLSPPPSAISLLACRLKALEDRWGVIWKGLSTF